MNSFFNLSVLEKIIVLGGLITVQFLYAVYGILLSYIMSNGISPLIIIIIGHLATSFFFFPISIIVERRQWPRTFRLYNLGQIVLSSFGGVTLYQSLMLYGVKKTSPVLASVMTNLAPGFVFIIASVLRFEKVEMKCFYSRVKIMGTLVSIIGVGLTSFMHSNSAALETRLYTNFLDEDGIVGTLCLLGGVLVLSFIVILQTATLRDFPAPVTLHAITSFLGAIFTAILQLGIKHGLYIGAPIAREGNLIGLAILGGIVSGTCGCFQVWAVKKEGPVFVSTLNPVATMFSVILSNIILGDSTSVASFAAMAIMFTGLYSVLWAKKQEDFYREDTDEEKPLLS